MLTVANKLKKKGIKNDIKVIRRIFENYIYPWKKE